MGYRDSYLDPYARGYDENYANAPAAAGGVGIPATLNAIYGSADPMQSLINCMENSTSPTVAKPTYMWIGNGATFTEVGGSGYDWVNTGALTEQSSSILGTGNHLIIDTNTDTVVNTADTEIQPVSNSFFYVHIFGVPTSFSTNGRTMGDRDSAGDAQGFSLRCNGAGGPDLDFVCDSATGGATTVSLATGLAADDLMVAGAQVDRTGGVQYIYLNAETRASGTPPSGALNNPNQAFGIGDYQNGVGELQHWGLTAFWYGAASELNWSTRVAQLFSTLS